jgi:polyphosphate kinase
MLELTTHRHRLEAGDRFLNRELSALDFNVRVFELASNPDLPLLERVRFLAITSGNLDEFFMVRVAGLMNQLGAKGFRSPDGRTPEETLCELRARVGELVRRQDELWLDELAPALEDERIAVGALADLSKHDRAWLARYFELEVFPILTPLAVGPGQPFPYISGLSLSLGLLVERPDSGEVRLARVKVPQAMPRLVRVGEGANFVPLEEVIAAFLPALFPGSRITACAHFRVTRDADFEISDDADDLLEAVSSKLRSRRFGDVVRLEISSGATDELVARLQQGLAVGERETYRIAGLLDLSQLSQLASLDRPDLKFASWEPVTPPAFRTDSDGLLAAIRREDLLVQHPYDSFAGSVERFLDSAAHGPQALALKTTVYRTNERSPLGPALSAAAEAGKQAVSLIELKARFDERHNIEWGAALERAGVHVVYGFPGLKIHAKLTLVVNRDEDGIRRYAHIGTGNYHALTAGLYEDFGLFTADPDITADVADLFNYLTGFGDVPAFRKLVVAPWNLRDRIVNEIDTVARAATLGRRARIRIKLNALVDERIIDALYDAAERGARIQIIARGICCLRPGVDGMSRNITVRSVLGRFLEHSRFYIFDADDATSVFLGSADLMERNLDRRIEVLAPVESEHARTELKRAFKLLMTDTHGAWELQPDGTWEHLEPESDQRGFSTHATLIRRASKRAVAAG